MEISGARSKVTVHPRDFLLALLLPKDYSTREYPDRRVLMLGQSSARGMNTLARVYRPIVSMQSPIQLTIFAP